MKQDEIRSRRKLEKEGPRIAVRRGQALNRRQWSAAQVKLLGKFSDDEVGRRIGYSRTNVCSERVRRGIPPFAPRSAPHAWTAREAALLGTASDAAVAAELGVSRSVVTMKRRVLGIPPFNSPPRELQAEPWTAEEDALLGTISDARLAEALARSRMAVYLRRRMLGIRASKPGPVKIRWTKRRLARLGRGTDSAVAREMGLHKSSVQKKRLALGIAARVAKGPVLPTRELKRLLHLANNIVLARTGLKSETINDLREKYGIEAPTSFIESPWTPQAMERLGKVTDAQLADELGVCLTAARGRRLAAGRAPSRPQRPWTAAEVELLQGHLSLQEVAERLGRSVATVRAKLHYMRKRQKRGTPRRR